jgi:hypothetical protein
MGVSLSRSESEAQTGCSEKIGEAPQAIDDKGALAATGFTQDDGNKGESPRVLDKLVSYPIVGDKHFLAQP